MPKPLPVQPGGLIVARTVEVPNNKTRMPDRKAVQRNGTLAWLKADCAESRVEGRSGFIEFVGDESGVGVFTGFFLGSD